MLSGFVDDLTRDTYRGRVQAIVARELDSFAAVDRHLAECLRQRHRSCPTSSDNPLLTRQPIEHRPAVVTLAFADLQWFDAVLETEDPRVRVFNPWSMPPWSAMDRFASDTRDEAVREQKTLFILAAPRPRILRGQEPITASTLPFAFFRVADKVIVQSKPAATKLTVIKNRWAPWRDSDYQEDLSSTMIDDLAAERAVYMWARRSYSDACDYVIKFRTSEPAARLQESDCRHEGPRAGFCTLCGQEWP